MENNSAQPTVPNPVLQAIPEPVKPNTPKTLLVSLIVLELLTLSVAGYFGYQFVQLKKLVSNDQTENNTAATEQPASTTEQPTISIVDMASWKNYSNTVHGVSFKYPPSWNLTQVDGQNENGKVFNTRVELKRNDTTISMVFNLDGIGGMPETYEGTAFVLDGHNLFQFNKINSYNNTKEVGISNSSTTLGVFMIDDITYHIIVTYPNTYNKQDEQSLIKEFDQILSTFKFTK